MKHGCLLQLSSIEDYFSAIEQNLEFCGIVWTFRLAYWHWLIFSCIVCKYILYILKYDMLLP